MLVKAQALLHAAQWLEANHGREAVARALTRCSPAVNERYMSAIAIEWTPAEEFIELLEAIEKTVGSGSGQTARDSGSYSARHYTRGVVKRSLFYLASPEFLLRRIAGLWRQYNDAGELLLHQFTDRKVVIELARLPAPHRLLCASVTGWIEVMAEAVGAHGSKASHPSCRARGDLHCTFVVDWDASRGLDERVQSR